MPVPQLFPCGVPVTQLVVCQAIGLVVCKNETTVCVGEHYVDDALRRDGGSCRFEKLCTLGIARERVRRDQRVESEFPAHFFRIQYTIEKCAAAEFFDVVEVRGFGFRV